MNRRRILFASFISLQIFATIGLISLADLNDSTLAFKNANQLIMYSKDYIIPCEYSEAEVEITKEIVKKEIVEVKAIKNITIWCYENRISGS